MSLHEVPPLEEEQELAPRPRRWWRWVAVAVVVAMVIATPFVYVFSHASHEPRLVRIPAGRTVTFGSGAVEPGDTVRCVQPSGVGIGAVVPEAGGVVDGHADGATSFASITVETASDGRVTVVCAP